MHAIQSMVLGSESRVQIPAVRFPPPRIISQVWSWRDQGRHLRGALPTATQCGLTYLLLCYTLEAGGSQESRCQLPLQTPPRICNIIWGDDRNISESQGTSRKCSQKVRCFLGRGQGEGEDLEDPGVLSAGELTHTETHTLERGWKGLGKVS